MTRAEAHDVRLLYRTAAAYVGLDQVAGAVSELLGTEVEFLLGRVSRARESTALDDGVSIMLMRLDGGKPIVVEVERALATNAIARALRREPPPVIAPAAAGAPVLAGAFAAVVAAAARRANAGTALRVRALPAQAENATEPHPTLGTEALTAAVTVLLARDAFAARAVVPCDSHGSLDFASQWDASCLSALGRTPLRLPVVACASLAALADISELREGEAFLPGLPWPLSRTEGGSPIGPVLLAAPRSPDGLRAELVGDGRLVLRGGVARLLEEGMDPDDKETVIAALADVPVVVRVEIGEAVLSAREWADLRRGDVIALGRRVGEPVVLRVQGIALARGELVDLAGEVAVRIVERIGGGGAP